ncbi:MAG: TonB-dependent receptor [Cellvibrionaceae bacterium]
MCYQQTFKNLQKNQCETQSDKRASAKSRVSIIMLSGVFLGGLNSIGYADHDVDEIVIVGESQLIERSITIEGDALRVANTADFLKAVPGANLNRNGPLTALPQYRGATGDRVSVIVDGLPMVSSGPNAMDAPVSSVPGANLKSLSVSRGIASVSAGQQTLGGHVVVTSRHGEYSSDNSFDVHARVSGLYNDNNDGFHGNVLTYISNNQHKLGAAFSYQDGENAEFSKNASGLTNNNEIPNTFFDRKRVNIFYGFQSESYGLDLNAVRINTNDTGTAALPMDIIYIDGESFSADALIKISDWQIDFQLGSHKVEHLMNNYDHRTPPSMMMGMMSMPMNRYNLAEGDHQNAKLMLTGPFINGEIAAGVDYSGSVYDANISDPTNAAFFLKNFNNVEKNMTGFFAEWVSVSESMSWELGARINQVESSADSVGAGGAPMMVAMNVMPLVMSFNQSDRDFDENNTDVVAKMAFPIFESNNSETHITAALARKTRAPSYQALYLWVPLQSTGGLADGKNYVGNLHLKSEVANEVNIGVDYSFASSDSASAISFQMFYREVDDYIQGTTEINSPLIVQMNMVSNMMGGSNALQYNNVDATLYGADVGYNGSHGDWYYRGNLSYVRGERDDVSDNLYRIAPLNHSLTIGKNTGNFDVSLSSELVAAQRRVSEYNSEQETAGYGLLHVNLRWQATPQLQAVFGIDNLLDKNYEAHLNGYNRVADADIARGQRLKGMGRNIRAGVSFAF